MGGSGAGSSTKKKKQKKSGWEHFASGAVAGAIDTMITMPLDTLKTNMQVSGEGASKSVASIFNRGGVRQFYAGLPEFMFQSSGKAAVRFYTFSLFQNVSTYLSVDELLGQTANDFTCGLGAGVVEALAWTTPTERVKVLKQTSKVGSQGSVLSLAMDQGLTGLYRGAFATAMRQSSSVAIRFTMYAPIKENLISSFVPEESRDEAPPVWVTMLAGGCGGAVSVCVNNPVDVVKSRLQGVSGAQYSGTLQCFTHILRNEGPLAFYKGLAARVPRLFLSQAIQFSVYEKVYAVICSK